jgi:hypothetical protein
VNNSEIGFRVWKLRGAELTAAQCGLARSVRSVEPDSPSRHGSVLNVRSLSWNALPGTRAVLDGQSSTGKSAHRRQVPFILMSLRSVPAPKNREFRENPPDDHSPHASGLRLTYRARSAARLRGEDRTAVSQAHRPALVLSQRSLAALNPMPQPANQRTPVFLRRI